MLIPCTLQAAKKSASSKSGAPSENGSSAPGTNGANTPMTSISANGSVEDLSGMAKLKMDTDRSGSGVLASDPKSRDIHIDSYSLSFHGRLLIEGASIALNYGQRYGLLGENGSGKTTFLRSLAQRDVEIPDHIDVRIPTRSSVSLLTSLRRSTSFQAKQSHLM